MMDSAGISQGQDNTSSPVLTPAADTGTQHVQESAPEERSFRQSEVNEIVKRAKYGAIEDFKRLQVEQPEYAQRKYGLNNQGQSSPSQSLSPQESEIRRLAAEEAQRLRDQWVNEARTQAETEYAQKTVNNFWNKISPGKEKYQDFDKVTSDIKLDKFPGVVQLLADYVDNSHDILYELGKNRLKLMQFEQLVQQSPQDAITEARKFSQSLKDNENASKVRTPNEPLSQMRPSNAGADNGVMSVSDYRQKYRV